MGDNNNILITNYFTLPEKKKLDTNAIVQDVNQNIQDPCNHGIASPNNIVLSSYNVNQTITDQDEKDVSNVEHRNDICMLDNTHMIPSRKRKPKHLNNAPQPLSQEQVANLHIDESNPTFKHFSPPKIKLDILQRPYDLDNSLLNTSNMGTLKSGKVLPNVTDQSTLKRRKSIRLLNQQTAPSDANKMIDTKNINHQPRDKSHKTRSINNPSSSNCSSRYVQQTLASSPNDTLMITKSVKRHSNGQPVGNENIQPNSHNVTSINCNASDDYVSTYAQLHAGVVPMNYQRPNIVTEAHLIHNDCKDVSNQLKEQLVPTPMPSKYRDFPSKEIEMTKSMKEEVDTLSKNKLSNKDVKIASIFLQTKKRNKNRASTAQKQILNDEIGQTAQNAMIVNNNVTTSGSRDNVINKTTVNAFQRLINSSKEIGSCKRNNVENVVVSSVTSYFPTISHIQQIENDNWIWHLPKVDIEKLYINGIKLNITKDSAHTASITLCDSLLSSDDVAEQIKSLKPRKSEALTRPVLPLSKSRLTPALHEIKEAFPEKNIDKLFSMFMKKKLATQCNDTNKSEIKMAQSKIKENRDILAISDSGKRPSPVGNNSQITKRSKTDSKQSSQGKITDFPIAKSFKLQHSAKAKQENNSQPSKDRNNNKPGRTNDEITVNDRNLASNTTQNFVKKEVKDKTKHSNSTQTKISELFLKSSLQKTPASISQPINDVDLDMSAVAATNSSTHVDNNNHHLNKIDVDPEQSPGVIDITASSASPLKLKTENLINVDKIQNETVNSPTADLLWTEKYRPRNRSEMIGNKKMVKKFYKWLKSWKVKLKHGDVKIGTHGAKGKRHLRPSDSEDDDDFQTEHTKQFNQEISDNCNTIVMSGPSGSGKTATVYACAEQLGMQVIEVNASSKRTGKLIMSQLREATQSHQVNFINSNLSDKPNSKPDTKSTEGNSANTKLNDKKDTRNNVITGTSKSNISLSELRKLSMTVILFEEVDVLFDVDDGFWSAVNSLMENAKIPIVLTCTDNALLHNLKLPYNHLIYKSPSKDIVTANMQVICLVEGVITNKNDITTIYRECKFDIRRTLLALQFWIEHPLLSYQPGAVDNDLNSSIKPGDGTCPQTPDIVEYSPEVDFNNSTVCPTSSTRNFPNKINNLLEHHLGLREFKKFIEIFLDHNWNETNKLLQSSARNYIAAYDQSRNLHLSYCNCLPIIVVPPIQLTSNAMEINNENKSLDTDKNDLQLTTKGSIKQSMSNSLLSKNFEKRSLAATTEFLLNNSFIDASLISSSNKDFDNTEMGITSFCIKDSLESASKINEIDEFDFHNAQVNLEIRNAVELTTVSLCATKVKALFKNLHQRELDMGILDPNSFKSENVQIKDLKLSPDYVEKLRNKNELMQVYEKSSSFLPTSQLLNRRAIATDYLPSLRTIMQSEDVREKTGNKRRFYHYSKHISLDIDETGIRSLLSSSLYP